MPVDLVNLFGRKYAGCRVVVVRMEPLPSAVVGTSTWDSVMSMLDCK